MARRFGYSRVSTSDQDWSLQLEALTKAGVDDRDIFREKASGAKRDRTELRRMLDLLRPGDQATVYRLDRLAGPELDLIFGLPSGPAACEPHQRPHTCQHPTTGHTAPEDFSCSSRGVHG